MFRLISALFASRRGEPLPLRLTDAMPRSAQMYRGLPTEPRWLAIPCRKNVAQAATGEKTLGVRGLHAAKLRHPVLQPRLNTVWPSRNEPHRVPRACCRALICAMTLERPAASGSQRALLHGILCEELGVPASKQIEAGLRNEPDELSGLRSPMGMHDKKLIPALPNHSIWHAEFARFIVRVMPHCGRIPVDRLSQLTRCKFATTAV